MSKAKELNNDDMVSQKIAKMDFIPSSYCRNL